VRRHAKVVAPQIIRDAQNLALIEPMFVARRELMMGTGGKPEARVSGTTLKGSVAGDGEGTMGYQSFNIPEEGSEALCRSKTSRFQGRGAVGPIGQELVIQDAHRD
jgi:hypothetical protein